MRRQRRPQNSKGIDMLDNLRRWFKHASGQDTVEVIAGDSLWRIAEHGVGDGARWRELVEANPDKGWTEDHTVIRPGERIKLPESWL